MTLNRLKGMWQSDESNSDQEFLFREIKGAETLNTKEKAKQLFTPQSSRDPIGFPGHYEEPEQFDRTDILRRLLDQCIEVVSRDPEVGIRNGEYQWDIWFNDKILSAIRCSSTIPMELKLRLLAFFALMIPFFDDHEKERVFQSLERIDNTIAYGMGEILTRQDLIHTEWLVRSIRRSKDLKNQMDVLRRSIDNRIASGRAA